MSSPSATKNRQHCIGGSPSVGDYLTREEALDLLGVKQQTLYTYVSRGFIRSTPQPNGRSSYYQREDVLRVLAKSVARSGHGAVAGSAMQWGEPVVDTRITELSGMGPRYRGHLAVDLAENGYSFECVAELLWAGKLPEKAYWSDLRLPPNFSALLRETASMHHHPHFLQLLGSAVMTLGIAEGSRRDRILAGATPEQVARRVIQALVGMFGFLSKNSKYACSGDGTPVAHGILHALGLRVSSERIDALNSALILAADHELNPATFAARIAASCGSDMHSCLGAAINTHHSSQIGRACDRIEEIFALALTAEQVVKRASDWRAGGRKLPGFDHPLYPSGDPRSRALIEIARSIDSKKMKPMLEALARLENDFDSRPGVETGLVFLCQSIGMPSRTATGIYAFGRCAGWIAHVLEQRLAGFIIRPRARYSSAEPVV